MAVLVEHYAGAFPLWLAPVQAVLVPIADRHNDYAESVARQLREAGFRVEVDERRETMRAKIRDAQAQQVPYMLVVGDRDQEAGTVSVRERRAGRPGRHGRRRPAGAVRGAARSGATRLQVTMPTRTGCQSSAKRPSRSCICSRTICSELEILGAAGFGPELPAQPGQQHVHRRVRLWAAFDEADFGQLDPAQARGRGIRAATAGRRARRRGSSGHSRSAGVGGGRSSRTATHSRRAAASMASRNGPMSSTS